MNTQKISPQGYNLQNDPLNVNPFWEQGEGGGNVPAGGTAGQVLTKRTAADYDTEWKTPESGGGVDWPEGGADGDILVKSGNSAEWETPDFPSTADLEDVEATAEAAATAAQEAKADLATETAARTAADTALGTRIGSVETDLAGYKTATDADIDALESGLASETTARTAADTALGGRIDSVESDLSHYETATDAELQTLNTEDARLEGLITAETEARTDADTLIREDLGADITAEATARQNGDNALRALIADNTGDIETQEGAISAINTRVTTAEGDIDSLETRVGAAETAISGKADSSTVSALETRLEGEIDEILPSYTTYQGTEFDPVTEDYTATGTGDTAAKYLLFSPDYGQNKIVKKLVSGVLINDTVPGGKQTGLAYIYGWPTGLCTLMAAGGLTTDQVPTTPYAGCLLVYNRYNATDMKARNNATWTKSIGGGTAGQVLTKKTNSWYDWEWTDPAGGSALPTGGNAGDLLAKTSTGTEWKTPNYATTTQLAGKADSSTVSALTTRVTTAESDIDNLETNVSGLTTRMTTAETQIGNTASIAAKVLNVDSYLSVNMGTLTAPDFIGLPWVWYDMGGTLHGFQVSDTEATNAPDAWAQYYSGGGGSYIGTPIYFDTPLKSGSTVLKNTTYGGSAGRLYYPTTSDIGTAISRQFTIQGSVGQCFTLEFEVSITSPDLTGYTFYGRATTTVHITTAADRVTIIGGHFEINNGSSTSFHGGATDDFKIAIANRGNANYMAYLGVNNSFINYLSSFTTTPYRFHVSAFNVMKLLGVRDW